MIRVGIIGCGYIGNRRAHEIAASFQSKLSVVCDTDAGKARALAARYHVPVVEKDWKRVVSDRSIDAVVVATTNDSLCAITVAALNAGKHVLCEKPLGRSLSEARAMLRSAVKHNAVLKVGFNLRFHPAVQKAHALFCQGAIGNLMYMRSVYGHGARKGYDKEWRMNPDISGGGELLDQGVHVLDLFRWFGGEFQEAFCVTEKLFWKKAIVEDNAFVLLKTNKGSVASAHFSITQWKNKFSFELAGSRGYLIIDGLGKSYGPERLIVGKRLRLGERPVEKVYAFGDEDVSWKFEWSDFVNALQKKRAPCARGIDGVKAHELLAALYRSARLKKMVRIGGN